MAKIDFNKVPKFSELPIKPDKPKESSWGVFGDDDELGCLNFLTPEGVIDTLGNSGQAFVDAAGAGEPLQALSALINTPAEAVGALLNGVPDQGFVGLIEPTLAGLLQTLAVDLPQTIAQALGAPAADSASAAADLTTMLDPSMALGDPSALLDPSMMLGDLSNLFDPSAITDIGTLLGADLAPNLGGIALDLLTSF